MPTIHVVGAKGGVGTSTVCALLALEHHAAGHHVILTAQNDDQGDLHALFGMAATEDPISLAPVPIEGPHRIPVLITVVDHGTSLPDCDMWATRTAGDRLYLVMRPCYLAIRRALQLNHRPDGIILVEEPGRALGARDITEVIGAPVVATLPLSQDLARMIDAGILQSRFARHSRTLRPLVQRPAVAA